MPRAKMTASSAQLDLSQSLATSSDGRQASGEDETCAAILRARTLVRARKLCMVKEDARSRKIWVVSIAVHFFGTEGYSTINIS